MLVLAAAALFPLLVVVADHGLPRGLPRPLIFAAGTLWAGATFLTLLLTVVRTLRRRWHRLFIARQLERAWNIAHNALINLVLIEQRPQVAYVRSGAERQASAALAGAEQTGPPPAARLRRPAFLLLGALAVWGVYSALTPKPILPSLARFFGAGRPAPTATRLELVRPAADEPVYAGEPLMIEVAVFGRPARQVWFELLDPADPDAGALIRSRFKPVEQLRRPRRWQIDLAGHEVSQDLHYRCTAGDGVLTGVIHVLPQPALSGMQIELEPPGYLAQPPTRTIEPELEVWAGTRATFRAIANTDIVDPVFVLRGQGEKRTRMDVEPDEPRCAVLSLRLNDGGEYWIEFVDRHGRSCREPPHHRLVVRHDAPPRVTITTPNPQDTPGDVVDITRVARLRVVAADDVELAGLWLVQQAVEREERVDLLAGRTAAAEQSVAVEIATSDLPVEVGQSLRVWFEAQDNRALPDGSPAPQTGRSRTLTLIRTPQLAAADEAPPTDPSLTGDGVPPEPDGEVVSGQGEPGEGGSAGAGRQGGEGPAGEGPIGGQYRRSSEEEQAEQQDTPANVLDPNWVDVVGEGEGAGDAAVPRTDDQQPTAATQQFEEELRRFTQKHGEEARELSERLGSRPEQQRTEGAPGQPGSGGGAGERPDESSPLEPDRAQGSEQAEPLTQPPASAPVEPNQPAASQPTETQGRPRQQSEREQRPSDSEGQQRAEPPGEQPASQQSGSERSDQTERSDESAERSAAEGATAEPEPAASHPEAEAAEQPSGAPADQQDGGEPGRPPTGGRPELDEGGRTIALAQPPKLPPELAVEGRRRAAGSEQDVAPDTGRAGELVDALELLSRAEDISDEQLAALGWSPARREAFLRDLDRLRAAASRAGVLAELKLWRARAEAGSLEVQVGAGISSELEAEVVGGSSFRDGLERIAPPPHQRVPRQLELILNAYYRALAEERAQRGKTQP